eukprot:1225223-Prymnesium_polylepis.1
MCIRDSDDDDRDVDVVLGQREEDDRREEEHEARGELLEDHPVLLRHVTHGTVDRALGPAQRQVQPQDVREDAR